MKVYKISRHSFIKKKENAEQKEFLETESQA
jgi:hypothetical protein